MAVHTGSAGLVKVGGNTVAEVTGFTIETTADVIETTALANSAKSFVASRSTFTATIECHFDETDSGQEALDVGTQATLELYPEGADSGDKYYSGSGIVTGASIAVTLDGIISRTFNFQISGGISHLSV